MLLQVRKRSDGNPEQERRRRQTTTQMWMERERKAGGGQRPSESSWSYADCGSAAPSSGSTPSCLP